MEETLERHTKKADIGLGAPRKYQAPAESTQPLLAEPFYCRAQRGQLIGLLSPLCGGLRVGIQWTDSVFSGVGFGIPSAVDSSELFIFELLEGELCLDVLIERSVEDVLR